MMKKWVFLALSLCAIEAQPALAASAVDYNSTLGRTVGTPAWQFLNRPNVAIRRGFFTGQRDQPHFLPTLRVDSYSRAVRLDNAPYSYCRKSVGKKECEAVVKVQGQTHRFRLHYIGTGFEVIQDGHQLLALIGNSLPFTLVYRDEKMRPVNLTFPGGLIASCEGNDWRECEVKAAAACKGAYSVQKRFERRSHFSPVRTARDIVAICDRVY